MVIAMTPRCRRWYIPIVTTLLAVPFSLRCDGVHPGHPLPINGAAVEPHRLTRRVFEWPWVRAFGPGMGHTEVLYVTELVGLVLTWTGCRISLWPVRVAASMPEQ